MNTYNDKAFLLPDSINSCDSYHAKVLPNKEYMFHIHDCNGGIRLRGDLSTPEGVDEAFDKVEALIKGLVGFQNYIYQNYIKTSDVEDQLNELFSLLNPNN